MFGSTEFWSTKIRTSKKLGAKSLAKIGSVTVEILLTWTNVARTNVAWTNITVAVADVPRNLRLKFRPN